MTAIILISLAAGLMLALLVAARRVLSDKTDLPLNTEWIDDLSIERYRPMMRLLDARDIEFLRTQPGFTPRIAARLRAKRCQIFREYLRCLSADFNRVCMALKVLMLQSGHDRPDLAAALVRSQVRFVFGVMAVQVRLVCFRFGVCGVSVSGLVGTFDGLRIELRALVPADAGAAA